MPSERAPDFDVVFAEQGAFVRRSLSTKWVGCRSEDMTLLVEIMIGVAERVARGLVFLSVIEPSARPPGRAARQIMGAAARQLKDKLRAGAWATGSTGTGHLAPPIINSYLFLTRSPLNRRFFREASDAARWLAPYTEQFTDQDILRQCSEMKLRIDRHAGG